MARRRTGEAHVRIYAHEMRTDAWRTLSPAARAPEERDKARLLLERL